MAQPSTASSPTEQVHSTPDRENESSKDDPEQAYPPTSRVILIIVPLYLTAFLIALDRLIIGVAVPSITNQFHSLGDVGWYGSAYLLTSAALILVMGRVYTIANPKWVYLSSLITFEIGSAICGAAPNSKALIIGRAIAGLGQAGLFQGTIIIMVYLVPLHKRPQYMGFGGMVFGIASALGPLIGGAFVDGPGWRWCFYVNLPCGAVVLAILVIFLRIPPGMLPKHPSTPKEVMTRLDPLGAFLFLPCVICLLLALQWGGVSYNWSNARIIVLLIVSAALFIAFILVQRWKGEDALVPKHIFFNRSILAGSWFSFFTGASVQTLLYYLPIWFQAIKGASAVKSGIMSLPLVLTLVIAALSAGTLTRRINYFTPWMILSAVLTPIGVGLISTFTPHTAHPAWIGYQALTGLGLGLGAQQPSVAAQTVLPRKDVPIGASLMMFSQVLGGAVFISVGNNLFETRLARNLARIPGINLGSVVHTGATELRKMVTENLLPQVLEAYNDALREMFYLVTALTCLTVFGAVTMEWKSVNKDKGGQKNEKHASGNDKSEGSNSEEKQVKNV